jgi:hypothetical protein
MKDPRATKQILGIEVYRDGKNGKLWLSHVYGEDIDELQYEQCDLLENIPLTFHCKIFSSLFRGSKEENDYVSHVPYVNEMFKYFTCNWCCQSTHGKTT